MKTTIIICGLASIFFAGCGQPAVQVKSNPNRPPLSINQLAKISKCTTTSEIISMYSEPKSITENGWLFNISDSQLTNDVIFKYADSSNVLTEIAKLPYKENDVLRDKYFYYLKVITDLKCDINEERFSFTPMGNSYAQRLERQRHEEKRDNNIQRYEDKVQEYEDKILDLKEKLMNKNINLPIWYQYKL